MILGIGWVLVLAYAFPGYMSADSVSQLAQARGIEVLSDGHPPFMAMTWRCLEWFSAGPFAMLLLQTGALLFGLDSILQRYVSRRSAALIAVLVLVLPPVLAPMGVIWKDSQMCGFAMLGIAMLAGGRMALGCAVLLAATAMRYNAPAAMFPLVVLLFRCTTGWRRYAIALGVWVALTAVAFEINIKLTQQQEHEWYSSLALHDIAGTLRFAPRCATRQIDLELAGTPLVAKDEPQKHCRWQYQPTTHWNLWHGERRIFDPPRTDAERDAIATAWWAIVTHHPKAYAKHRWAVFDKLLSEPSMQVWGEFVENDYQRTLVMSANHHSELQQRWLGLERWLSTTFLFHPGFYLVLALALLPLCRDRLAFAMLTSGICHELALLPLAPSNDFRYSHWMIVCTVVGLVIVLVTRSRGGAR